MANSNSSKVEIKEMTEQELEKATAPSSSVPEISSEELVIEHQDLDMSDADRKARDNRMVKIRPRRTVLRTRLPGVNGEKQYYNFFEGKECTVPAFVRDWLFEKGVL